MSTYQHDVVIATFSDYNNRFEKITNYIKKLNLFVEEKLKNTEFIVLDIFYCSKLMTNGFFTVVMFPDGSGEGWRTSNVYDEVRSMFVGFAKKENAVIVHVSYGEEPMVVQTNAEIGSGILTLKEI